MKGFKNFIYQILDVLTFNKGINRRINHITVRFPAKWARYFESNYEHENAKFILDECKSDDVVFDIGAHIGLMSVTLAKSVIPIGKVYSFEPTPHTFKILKDVVKLNTLIDTIIPVNMAIGNSIGTMNFYLAPEEGNNANSLVSKNHRDRVPVKIEVTTLDAFIHQNRINKLNFLKIDAEGSEYDVLMGGLETIRKFMPKIILAIHPPLIENNGQKPEMIFDLLIQLNYKVIYNGNEIDANQFCKIRDFFDVHLLPINR